ncbi:MAG: acetolactate synthase, partial [Thermoleophilia bacterium]|nr:acetolactate synthase [Thermoleophilia bacterium]
ERFVTWDFPADLRITADDTAALRALRLAVEDIQTSAQRKAALERRQQIVRERQQQRKEIEARARARSATKPIHPEWVAWCLKHVLPEDAIILEDAVTNRIWVRTHLTTDKPETIFTPGGSCLGWAMNAAIGVKLAKPERLVVSLMGDGGFTFANPLAALWTAQKAGAPSLTVIFNNGGYNAAQTPIAELYPGGAVEQLRDGVVTKIDPRPVYAKVAEACGAFGVTVTEPVELEGTLRRAVDEVTNGRSAVVDVILAAI